MEKSSLFIEIFGLDEITAPPLHDVPSIPVMDDEPMLRKRSGSSANVQIAEIERDTLIDQLCPIPTEARIEADLRKFSPTPAAAPGLEKIMEEVLPTARVLGEWTPTAGAMFGDLLTKMVQPSRKVCQLRFSLKDGSHSCCPITIADSDTDATYQDTKTGKVFSLQANVSGIESCTDHCEAA